MFRHLTILAKKLTERATLPACRFFTYNVPLYTLKSGYNHSDLSQQILRYEKEIEEVKHQLMEQNLPTWKEQMLMGKEKLLLENLKELRANMKELRAQERERKQKVYTAEEIHNFVIGLATVGRLKQDKLKTRQLARNITNFDPTERDTAIQEIYDVFEERWTARKKAADSSDRLHNILVATQAAPGGGKSFLLDLVANKYHLHLCKDPQLRELLSDSVPLALTFNSGTSYEQIEADLTPEVSLALRVLFAYYFDVSASWDLFLEEMINANILPRLSQAIRCVHHAEGRPRGILLLVDELMKSKDPQGTASAAGSVLNEFESVNVVVTTLDESVIDAAMTSSGRFIRWIKLTRLSLNASINLFETKFGKVPSSLAKVISDCAGHPRTLEIVADVWQSCFASHGNDVPYSRLMATILRRGEGYFNKFTRTLTDDMVYAALSGRKVNLDDRLPNGRTFRSCIEHGQYTNSLSSGKSFIPILPPIALYAYAKTRPLLGSDNEPTIYFHVLQLLEFEPRFTWDCFEVFHAHWECIRRHVLRALDPSRTDSGVKLIATLYDNPILRNTTHDPSFQCTVKKVSPPLAEFITKQTKLDDSILDTKEENVSGVANPVDYILRACQNQKGFDLLTVERMTDGQSFVIATECRYSKPASSTQLTLQDVMTKHRFVFNDVLAGYKPENVFLVFAAFRNPTDEVKAENLPKNTIILDRQQLTRLYTPSLIYRPQFLEWIELERLAGFNNTVDSSKTESLANVSEAHSRSTSKEILD